MWSKNSFIISISSRYMEFMIEHEQYFVLFRGFIFVSNKILFSLHLELLQMHWSALGQILLIII